MTASRRSGTRQIWEGASGPAFVVFSGCLLEGGYVHSVKIYREAVHARHRCRRTSVTVTDKTDEQPRPQGSYTFLR